MSQPQPFEYTNYRTFLRELFAFHKATKKFFSHRYIARRAGFSSPNFLKLVIDHKRNLTHESIAKLCRGFALSASEADFFENLVYFNQAESDIEKSRYLEKLSCSKALQKINPIHAAQFRYYQDSATIPIRELINVEGFKNDPKWISENLRLKTKVNQVNECLETLQLLELIKKDDQECLQQVSGSLNTENEVSSLAIREYHKEMMVLAAESIEAVDRTEREISSVCISVSKETMQHVKKRIQDFRQEILTLVNKVPKTAAVYQLNFQFFPLSKWIDPGVEEK
jgi:uncharacterized protein (TIGR02147 family)